MYDVKVLEQQWIKYKIQQSIPWIVLGAIVLFIFIVGLWTSYNKQKDKTVQSEFSLFLHESLDLATLEQNKTQIIASAEIISDNPLGEIEMKDTLYAPNIPNIFPVEPLGVVADSPRERVVLDIHKSAADDAINDVKNRFYNLKDPNDALFLAMTFYGQGKYEDAHDWAVEVNKITNNIEESWLVLARSKAKLGQKKDAIDLLRAYAQEYDSQNASRLIEQIEQGRL